jgi:hypothetical protein
VLSGTIPPGWSVSSGGGPFTITAGSANDGTLVLDDAAPAITDSAPFTNSGTIVDQSVHSSRFTTPTLTNLGTIELPANETLKLGGALSVGSSSVLEFDLDGTALGAFGRLQIAGSATLAGTLQVVRGGSYAPVIGDRQQILTAGSLSGSFSQTLGGNGSTFYATVYRPTSVTVQTEQPQPVLSGLQVSPRAFRPCPHGSPLSSGGPGAIVRYTDTEAATTRFTVYRKSSGRLVKVGSFTHHDSAGRNRAHFSGRLAGRALRAADYELAATATLDHRASRSVHTSFSILSLPRR